MNKNCCLICGNKSFSELIRIESFPIFWGAIPFGKQNAVKTYPLAIGICNKCALVQQLDLLDSSVLNNVYTAECYNCCPSPVETRMGVREIDKFYSFFSSTGIKQGKLLEIACFDGYLLNKFQENGWDVYGCDPCTTTSIARKNLGESRIKNEFFQEKTYQEKSFDVIIFRNLLEHLYDLHGFLQTVFKTLTDQGSIFIDVPNIDTYLGIGGFGSFFHHHLSYFSLQTLSALISQNGFSIVKSEQGTSIFVQAVKKNNASAHIIQSKIDIKKSIESFVSENTKIKNKVKTLFNSSFKKIALIGASAQATTMINMLTNKELEKLSHILDNDSSKHGKNIFGCNLPILSPKSITPNDFDCILISTYIYENELREQLIALGVPKEKIISLYNDQ